MRIFVAIILALLFFPSIGYAQEDPYVLDWNDSDTKDATKAKQSDEDKYEDYGRNVRGFVNTGVVFFPLYSRSNGQAALGADLMYYFRRSTEPPLSEPSYLRTFFSFGRNDFATIGTSFNNYWSSEKYNLYSSFLFNRQRSAFFEPFKYTPAFLASYRATDLDLNLMFRTRLSNYSYVGIKYDFAYSIMDNKDPVSAFDNRTDLIGLNGGPASGVGITWNNEPVDDLFSPKTNFVFDIEGMLYSKGLGSDFDFGKYTISLKEYYNIAGLHTIVFNVYSELHSGHVPYSQLSRVGNIFNAYSVDKYTGRQLVAMKGEYRMPIFARTFLTGFIGTAYIASTIKKLRLNDNLPSYGGGVRFLVDKALNINARLDIVSGRDGAGVWLGLGEGF